MNYEHIETTIPTQGDKDGTGIKEFESFSVGGSGEISMERGAIIFRDSDGNNSILIGDENALT